MRRFVFLLGFVTIVIVTVVAAKFYVENLRGIGPAITNPSEDISIPVSIKPGENNSGLPLKLPDGFAISIFAKNVGGARVLLKDTNGTLLLSLTSQGKVVALPDSNQNGEADQVKTLLSGLNNPHGLAISCRPNCQLYVAQTDSVLLYDYNPSNFAATNRRKIIDLPSGGGHFTRTLLLKDNRLYISIGSSCNVCNESDNRRAKIFVANLDGSDFKQYASGLRNSVFMTTNPATNELWATEMGRDLLGDNIPPEEVNIIKEGGNYGWPNCYADKVKDSSFNPNTTCENTLSPHIKMQAHSAPLGLAFVASVWPKEYDSDLLVAYHGSWNRSVPTGYKIVRMKLDRNGKFEGEEDFITGWLSGSSALGRPVDILLDGKKGYISDDKAGVVYYLTTLQ